MCTYMFKLYVPRTCVFGLLAPTQGRHTNTMYNYNAQAVHVHVYTHATILIDKSLANQKKKAVGIIIWTFHLYLSHCILKLVN